MYNKFNLNFPMEKCRTNFLEYAKGLRIFVLSGGGGGVSVIQSALPSLA
jgi:hypothetical protein